jgi:hypothetical protein
MTARNKGKKPTAVVRVQQPATIIPLSQEATEHNPENSQEQIMTIQETTTPVVEVKTTSIAAEVVAAAQAAEAVLTTKPETNKDTAPVAASYSWNDTSPTDAIRTVKKPEEPGFFAKLFMEKEKLPSRVAQARAQTSLDSFVESFKALARNTWAEEVPAK